MNKIEIIFTVIACLLVVGGAIALIWSVIDFNNRETEMMELFATNGLEREFNPEVEIDVSDGKNKNSKPALERGDRNRRPEIVIRHIDGIAVRVSEDDPTCIKIFISLDAFDSPPVIREKCILYAPSNRR